MNEKAHIFSSFMEWRKWNSGKKDIEIILPTDNVPTVYENVMRKALDVAFEKSKVKNMKVISIEYKGVIYSEEGWCLLFLFISITKGILI